MAGGLVNMLSQHRAGQRARRADRQYRTDMAGQLAGERRDIASFLEPAAHQDYLQTDQAQSALTQAREQLMQQARQVRGGVASSGGTVDAAVAGQTAMAQGYSGLMNQLAGQGSRYQDQARARLMYALQQHGRSRAHQAGIQHQMGERHAHQIGAAGQGFGTSLVDLAGALALPA